jgi:hypothetical protein
LFKYNTIKFKIGEEFKVEEWLYVKGVGTGQSLLQREKMAVVRYCKEDGRTMKQDKVFCHSPVYHWKVGY